MRLAPLFGIEAVAFLLIIAETYLFFNLVVPLGPVPHSLAAYTGLTLLKLLLSLGLVALWFVVMIGLTRTYVKAKIRNAPKPSS
ncbi:MAG TPA: hypothetical protein VED22_08085 [Nitrososphaerales archaeon]|nr:hypothetical protein [Nitrososphaerales archaeon]